MYKTSLVLEGGGMRGTYTAGVLDFFMEKGLDFSSVYGVSAGALNAANFVSKQPKRGARVLINYLDDERYSGKNYLIKTGDYFNIDFVYNTIPNDLDPCDYETFKNNPIKFYSVVSNVVTGKPEYLYVSDLKNQIDLVRASASLPLLSNIVEIDRHKYLDGGICDSIPLHKSILDGNEKNVVVLTQHRGFVKKQARNLALSRVTYRKYPKFVEAMEMRHLMYNNEIKYAYQMEEKGKAFIIQPQTPVKIGRLEKDKSKLWELYAYGYKDAQANYEKLMEYLEK